MSGLFEILLNKTICYLAQFLCLFVCFIDCGLKFHWVDFRILWINGFLGCSERMSFYALFGCVVYQVNWAFYRLHHLWCKWDETCGLAKCCRIVWWDRKDNINGVCGLSEIYFIWKYLVWLNFFLVLGKGITFEEFKDATQIKNYHVGDPVWLPLNKMKVVLWY